MIRVAIVEDEKEYAQIICNYLKRYEKEHSVQFHVRAFEDGLDIASDYKPEFDIIFLDIQMKHMDGMRAAEEIRKLDEDVAFIFITSTIQFAVQGYMVDALGYVLKPVPYLAFSQIVGKAIRKAERHLTKTYLTVDTESGQMRMEINQIYYMESQGHYILLHTEKGDFLTSGPLKRFEEELCSRGFSKCHNAYLVNLSHVTGTRQTSLTLTTGVELPVSRMRKKVFLDNLNDYIGGIHR